MMVTRTAAIAATVAITKMSLATCRIIPHAPSADTSPQARARRGGDSLRFLEAGIVGRHTLRLHEGNSDRPFERAMLMLHAVTIPFRQQSRMSRIAIVRRIESRLNPDLFSALRSSSPRLFLFPLWERVSRHFHRVQCGLSPFYPSMSRRLLTPMRALPRTCADL